MTHRTVKYGGQSILYSVVKRPSRRTLGIEVHPDGRVLVLAPPGCDESTIAERVLRRVRWISRQLVMFSRYEPRTVPRQYLSGECHRYLGRQYRLRISGGDCGAPEAKVKLTRGELVVSGPRRPSREKVKELLQNWYLKRAAEIFESIATQTFQTFAQRGIAPPQIAIREMKRRWGSLSPRGQMTLNLRLIQAPRRCIEYVVVHELCHLVHRDHSRSFFRLLRQAMPDWEARKQRLEEYLL